MASDNPRYKLSLMETLYIAPRNPKYLEMFGYQPVFGGGHVYPTYICVVGVSGRVNSGPNLQMQEESKD